jgi:hypothetical protein
VYLISCCAALRFRFLLLATSTPKTQNENGERRLLTWQLVSSFFIMFANISMTWAAKKKANLASAVY